MGEYTIGTIYKAMAPKSFLSNTYQKTTWDLFEAKDDEKRKEEIYRAINFINNDGSIFDLNMRFLERNGKIYQTNGGVLGTKELPNLLFSYKFELPDFWVSIVKPSEMKMDANGFIHIELSGKVIHERFQMMMLMNAEKLDFLKSPIYIQYMGDSKYSALVNLIGKEDIVVLSIGLLFEEENLSYKDAARKNITNIRKRIAESYHIPHWESK